VQAHRLALAVYKATTQFPREEAYGLRSQMRRAASSIPANIAEGCGRTGEAEFARFLRISMGSASELEYLLMLAWELNLLARLRHKQLSEATQDIKRMLTSLVQKLTADC